MEYLLNPESKLIHYQDCPTIEYPTHYIKSSDYTGAAENGYRPCQRCNPVDLNK